MNHNEGRKYFRMKDACSSVGVEAHVIRFWEKEFPQLQFRKNASGHRMFSRENIQCLQDIKQLLHVEGLTIEGARKKLSEKPQSSVQQVSVECNHEHLKSMVGESKKMVEDLIKSLDST